MSGQDLIDLSNRLATISAAFDTEYKALLDGVLGAAQNISLSWSGSNLGYHADVYYNDLKPRPVGEQFSIEWGLSDPMGYGDTDWVEFDRAMVRDAIFGRVGRPDLSTVELSSEEAARSFRDIHSEVVSILSLDAKDDSYLKNLLEKAKACEIRDVSDLVRAQVPSGQIMSRDAIAASQGLRAAPHQSVIAEHPI